jgi:hypothetical protein
MAGSANGEAPGGASTVRETNDRADGVTADVDRAWEYVPPVLTLLGLVLFAVVAVVSARRRLRNAVAAARLAAPPPVIAGPGAGGQEDPALTPEGHDLLQWLLSQRPPDDADVGPAMASEVERGGDGLGKACPYCGGSLPLSATECGHCGEFIDDRSAQVAGARGA